MKRVKIINKYNAYDLPVGTEFNVENEDDGFYSLCPFYQGWIKLKDGRKIYASFDQKMCKVIEWD